MSAGDLIYPLGDYDESLLEIRDEGNDEVSISVWSDEVYSSVSVVVPRSEVSALIKSLEDWLKD